MLSYGTPPAYLDHSEAAPPVLEKLSRTTSAAEQGVPIQNMSSTLEEQFSLVALPEPETPVPRVRPRGPGQGWHIEVEPEAPVPRVRARGRARPPDEPSSPTEPEVPTALPSPTSPAPDEDESEEEVRVAPPRRSRPRRGPRRDEALASPRSQLAGPIELPEASDLGLMGDVPEVATPVAAAEEPTQVPALEPKSDEEAEEISVPEKSLAAAEQPTQFPALESKTVESPEEEPIWCSSSDSFSDTEVSAALEHAEAKDSAKNKFEDETLDACRWLMHFSDCFRLDRHVSSPRKTLMSHSRSS